jgi:peptidoglycan/xylan/chitin deacetylase (PgdA/CDA1 family)
MGGARRIASRTLAAAVRLGVRTVGRGPRFVLTYHGVGEAAGAVPSRVFEDQILHLRRARYEIVPLSAMVGWLVRGEDLPGRAVALTFDDGLADTASVAAPILRRHRAPATVFPVLGFLGGPRRFASARARAVLLADDGDPSTLPWDYMAWDDLDRWVESGGEVGGHTLTHPFLSDLDAAQGRAEVAECRAALARRYGGTPEVFCYPFGDDGGDARRWAQEAGYAAAVTSRPGRLRRGADPFRVPRLPAPVLAGDAFADLFLGVFLWRQAARRLAGAGAR